MSQTITISVAEEGMIVLVEVFQPEQHNMARTWARLREHAKSQCC
jgi:hypothetical protein